MYILLVFLFKNVDFPQVAVMGAIFCTNAKKEKDKLFQNKCFKNTLNVCDLVFDCICLCHCNKAFV